MTSYIGWIVAALLAVVSLGGLVVDSAYARETPAWIAQAVAQDWFDLVVAVPCIAIAGALFARGSRRAQIVLSGFLLYAVYTMVIYCFGVHLNALFLVYCATLGCALFGLIALAGPVLVREVTPAAHRVVGGYLVFIAVAFTLLWLAQIVPALRTGEPPRELVETGLATNPVHVLDLSFVLPLHLVAGVMLWRRHPSGVALAAGLLAFGALMAGSIGFMTAGVVAIAMGVLAVVSAAMVAWLLRD